LDSPTPGEMKAYYFDNAEGDPRLPHFDERLPTVDTITLENMGIKYWAIPVDKEGKWEHEINKVSRERSYKNRDTIHISKAGLGDAYESKMKIFFTEHMHEDEEIRYILDGTGYFDVRETPSDAWVRIQIEAGDLLILPAGIYHRFTLDQRDYLRAMRLFKEEPLWTPYNRSEATEANPFRVTYLKDITLRTSDKDKFLSPYKAAAVFAIAVVFIAAVPLIRNQRLRIVPAFMLLR